MYNTPAFTSHPFSKFWRIIPFFLLFLSPLFASEDLPSAIFKIHAYAQARNLATPWLSSPPSGGTGSGFVIEGNQVLTNAHIVSHAKYLEVQKQNDAKRYIAKIQHISHVNDLALLEIPDPDFFTDITPLGLGGIPELDSIVKTIGFPMGGAKISVTNGVVSRIDKIIYSHSGIDEHMVIQTDAAINPGNSGGPVLQNGEVVGMAFQGFRSGDNIGYMIPTTIIRHFIEDAADGIVHGVPELGCFFTSLPPVMRDYLELPVDQSGILIVATNPQSKIHGQLKKNDVLTHINSHSISDDGHIMLDGQQFAFYEFIERSQYDEKVTLTFFREKKSTEISVDLTLLHLPIDVGRMYEEDPEYVNYAGLTFIRLSGDYMRTFGKDWWVAMPQIFRLMYYHQTWMGQTDPRTQYVVISKVLNDPENLHARPFVNKIVDTINGIRIDKLADVPEAFKTPLKGYHIIDFMNHSAPMILKEKEARAMHRRILERYRVPHSLYLKTEEEAP